MQKTVELDRALLLFDAKRSSFEHRKKRRMTYRGLSFFSLYNAHKETLATLTILKRTPGISPTA